MERKGFTLIELLLVIAIIGILSTFILIQVNGARERAKISNLGQQLIQIENALAYTLLAENKNEWWTETELGMTNPTLSELLAIESGMMSGFSDYFPEGLRSIIDDTEFEYNHDGDSSVDCGTFWQGVNIKVSGLTVDQRIELDEYIDGEVDEECGKITYSMVPGALYLQYKISDEGSIFMK